MDKYFGKFDTFEVLQSVLKSQIRGKKKTVMQFNKKKLEVPETRQKKFSENLIDGFQDFFFKKEKIDNQSSSKQKERFQMSGQYSLQQNSPQKQSQNLTSINKHKIVPDFQNDFTAYILNKIDQKQQINKTSNNNSPAKAPNSQFNDLIDLKNINQKQCIDAKDMNKVLNRTTSNNKKPNFPQFLDLV